MKRRDFLKISLSTAAGLIVDPLGLPLRAGELFVSEGNNKPHPGDFPVIVLDGAPRKRGRIHGESCRAKINELVSQRKALLAGIYETDPDKYLEEFLKKTKFTDAIRKWTPALLDEVEGIAEGAGIDFETMMAFQFVDEEWWFGRNKRLDIRLPETRRCTVCGVYGQEGLPTLLAQNLDFFSFTHGHQVLLKIDHENSSLESYVLTYTGLIGTNGLNSGSVSVCVNALLQLDQRTDGLPVAFVVRGILEQPDYEKAVRFVTGIDHASGQAYTIGGSDEIASFERSANKVVPFLPYPGAKRIYHTNHPIVSSDQGIYKEQVLKKIPAERKKEGPGLSERRYATLEKRLKDRTNSRRVSAKTLKAALGSHDDPICCHKPENGSVGLFSVCSVMELSDSSVLNLSPGPACSTEFSKYTF